MLCFLVLKILVHVLDVIDELRFVYPTDATGTQVDISVGTEWSTAIYIHAYTQQYVVFIYLCLVVLNLRLSFREEWLGCWFWEKHAMIKMYSNTLVTSIIIWQVDSSSFDTNKTPLYIIYRRKLWIHRRIVNFNTKVQNLTNYTVKLYSFHLLILFS